MQNTFVNINQIIKLEIFQQLQDDISSATDLAIITIDHTGKPITSHSNCNKFCEKMRSSDHFHNLCEKCDARGGLEAVRIKDAYIYLCHAGIVDMAIPIIVDGLYLGAFMAGQILLDHEDDNKLLEPLLSSSNTINDIQQDPDLLKLYNKIPKMSLVKIRANAHMLNYFANLCIERSLYRLSNEDHKNKTKMISKAVTNPNFDFSTIGDFHLPNKKTTNSNNLIQPSLNYIKSHLNEKITLSKMADLCNISPSYYSRLFAKKNLGSLSSYVNELKINRAKELLATTDLTVNAIAWNLGFNDSGYFIKQFKNFTGTTPKQYKQNLELS